MVEWHIILRRVDEDKSVKEASDAITQEDLNDSRGRDHLTMQFYISKLYDQIKKEVDDERED